MPKQTLLLVLIFTLAACAQPSPAPTATPLPPTATLTPAPTSTPLPTPSPISTPTPWQIAINEYGIPQEQAEKLANLENAEFEVKNNVEDGGVLVKENGQDAYYFDGQTELLVSVDRWPIITDVEDIRSNEMTQAELFSDEYFAWLKYITSTLEFGDNLKYVDKKAVKTGPYTVHIVYEGGPNFATPEDDEKAPFKRMETLAYVHMPNGPDSFTAYGIAPLFEKDEVTGIVYPTITAAWTTEDDLIDHMKEWAEEMNITSIVSTNPEAIPDYPNVLVSITYEDPVFGDELEGENGRYVAYRDGDASALSEPGLVVAAIVTSMESTK